MRGTECGMVITSGGTTWVVRRNGGSQDLIPAEGIVHCTAGQIIAYRGRHIDYLTPKRAPLVKEQMTAEFHSTPTS